MSGRTLILQLGRFGTLGALATATHLSLAMAALAVGAQPWQANLAGFLAAVGLSYVGNARWTFAAPLWSPAQAARFIVVSLAGLALNQALTAAFSQGLRWPPVASVIVAALAVPALSFVAARLWVFRSARA
jgi:putative flippase GtrA